MNISIRRAGIEDVAPLQAISRQTFYDAFSADNAEENMKKYMEEAFSLEKLSAELSDPDSAFYFATLEDEVIGYLKLNFGTSQTELKDGNGIEIERIYVLEAFHGKKVGQLLYEKALETAGQKGVDYIWLGVWGQNHKAIGFYKKNGFVEFGEHSFWLGDDKQTDILMRRELNTL